MGSWERQIRGNEMIRKLFKHNLPARLTLLLVSLTIVVALSGCAKEIGRSNALHLKNPYLQNVTQDSITVRWETEFDSPSVVVYGTSTSYDRAASGRSFKIQPPATDVTLPIPDAFQHEVVIGGLIPSTEYHYQVITIIPPSEDSIFTTAATTSDPFRFVVHGDNRTNHDDHQAVVEGIIPTKPDFVVNTGDLVGEGGSVYDWDKFFEIEKPLLKSSPLYPCFGNHEERGGGEYLFKGYFSLPESTASGLYYSFNYGNSHFIIINTEGNITAGSDQYNWVANDLAAAGGNHDIVHIFAFFHRPAYSSGRHGGNDGISITDTLVPLFELYDVDIVFSGHDHDYERCQDPGLDRDQPEGTVYIVTGGGGAPLYSIDEENKLANPFYIGIFESKLHFCQIDVSGENIGVTVIDATGKTMDSFSTH